MVILAFKDVTSVFILDRRDPSRPSHPLVMFDEDLHHDVLELDVHDGGHRLLLWAEQRGPEDHAQVGHGHQVALVVAGHAVGHGGGGRGAGVNRGSKQRSDLLTLHSAFSF